MAKAKTTKTPKKRVRICFVPGCREAIEEGDEFVCPKHLVAIIRAGEAKRKRESRNA